MFTKSLLSGRPCDRRWLCEIELSRRGNTCLQECHTEAKQEHHKLEARPSCAERLHENESMATAKLPSSVVRKIPVKEAIKSR